MHETAHGAQEVGSLVGLSLAQDDGFATAVPDVGNRRFVGHALGKAVGVQ
jgi:hypothetical protein